MLSLQPHHITDIYCLVDDLLPQPPPNPQGGRPPILKDSELVTILVWNALALRQKTIKDLYQSVLLYHRRDFPRLPKYRAFVADCHRVTPICLSLLSCFLSVEQPVRIMDSTMLPVCRLKRADSHKVARNMAKFGKNHQGWHYGFKLHASIDPRGGLCGIALTPANVHDAQMMPKILDQNARIAVGDTLYGASVMGKIIASGFCLHISLCA
jgi:hypothetical protein